jgi:replication initiation protein RepC
MTACTLATTPFGRRSLSLAHVASQMVAKQRRPDAAVHKWEVFRALCTAKNRYSLSERSLAVLDALLSFHPETVLTGENLVVFPSNARLSLRAHGMSPATLRRHLAALVDAGVILRRDSPNGKRYARKTRAGEIERAFGFDLSPLIARANEFETMAEAIRVEERALRYARERITLARRDLAKMIATGAAENVAVPSAPGRPANWAGLNALYRGLVERLSPRLDLDAAERLAQTLCALADDVLKILEAHTKTQILSAIESQSERHIQNSNSEPKTELEPACEESRAASDAPVSQASRVAKTVFSLGMVLQACPDIADYARGGISCWRDLVAAASVARAALGISPSAWTAAQSAMGETSAAVVIAAILQRSVAITSAGGYLRVLTRKAQANEFSTGPMLMALIGARNREKRRS